MKWTLALLIFISVGCFLFGEITATWTKLKEGDELPYVDDMYTDNMYDFSSALYDPIQNCAYMGYANVTTSVSGLWKYDFNTNQFTEYPITNMPSHDCTMATLDQVNNRIIMIDVHDQTIYAVSTTGGALTFLGGGGIYSWSMFGRNHFQNPYTNNPVIMNGYGGFRVKNPVMEYNLATSTWITRFPDRTDHPWRRASASITTNEDKSKVYMFGGFAKQSGNQSGNQDPGFLPWASDMGYWNWQRDLWELDLSTWQWTSLLGPNAPSITSEGSICYMDNSNTIVMIGGYIPSPVWGNSPEYIGGVSQIRLGLDSEFMPITETGQIPPITDTANYSEGSAIYDATHNRILYFRYDGIWELRLGEDVVYDIEATPTNGDVPLAVAFDASPTPPDDALLFWDFDNDSIIDSNEPSPTHLYTEPGVYSVKLIVQNGTQIDSTLVENLITVTTPSTPRIVASPDTLRYGNVATNSTVTKPMNIYNWGGEDLEIFSISAANARYTITLPPGLSYPIVVPSLESIEIAVNFSPLAVQANNTNLVIVSNDPNNGVLTKWLEGNGYLLNADFSANPLSGDIPLLVQFTDMSQGDIVSRLWDFGDGNTSTELNPTHTYVQKGFYDVTLAVQDQYISRSITRPDYISAIAHPVIATPDSSGIDFGIVYLGDTGTHQLILQSAGTDSVFVTSVGLYQPSSAYSIAPESIPECILPGMQAILDISFHPYQASAYNDTLYVYNSSENKPILKIKLRGIGEYVPPQTPQGVTIVIDGYDAVISWEAVTQNIYNTPITVPYYFIYGSLIPNPGPTEQIFIGYSTGTTFHHAGVNLPGSNVQPPPQYFYTVTAVVWYPPRNINIALDDLIGRTKEEVERQLR